MCEQCLTNCITFGEVLPGFHLMRARRDGVDWKKGQWGLVEINDPTFTWYTTPVLNEITKDYFDLSEEFINALRCHPQVGYRLISAAQNAGYKARRDGFFEWWLYERIAKHILETDFAADDDPLPLREEAIKTDYSIDYKPLSNEKELIDLSKIEQN